MDCRARERLVGMMTEKALLGPRGYCAGSYLFSSEMDLMAGFSGVSSCGGNNSVMVQNCSSGRLPFFKSMSNR